MISFENTLDFAKKMDNQDPLKGYRNRFHFPDFHEKTIRYFTGNSLGLQPKSTKQYIKEELDDDAILLHSRDAIGHNLLDTQLVSVEAAKYVLVGFGVNPEIGGQFETCPLSPTK